MLACGLDIKSYTKGVMLIGVLKLNWLNLSLYKIGVTIKLWFRNIGSDRGPPIKGKLFESYQMEQRSRLHPV